MNDPLNANRKVVLAVSDHESGIDIPCVFCGHTKRERPERLFVTDQRWSICSCCDSTIGSIMRSARRGEPAQNEWHWLDLEHFRTAR